MFAPAGPRSWSTALALLLLVSGCATTDHGLPSASPSRDDPPVETVLWDPENESVDPPRWAVGQWWRWEIRPRDHFPYNVTTVVAHEAADHYTIGTVELNAGLRSTSFHVPPLGAVSKSDLEWMEHGKPVRVLSFPLEDGKTWTGTLDEAPLTVMARKLPTGTEILYEVNSTFDEGGQGPRGLYSPRLGQFLEYHHHYGSATPFASAILVDHGVGHAAPVSLLTPKDTYFGGATSVPDAPTAPEAFQATGPKDYLVFACFMAAGPGTFSASFVPPNGEETVDCELRNTQNTFERQVRVQHRSTIDGTWRVGYFALGTGWIGVEVLGVRAAECTPPTTNTTVNPCTSTR